VDAQLGEEIVGREVELGLLDDFLRSSRAPRGFVLAGGPGIGKTTLWEAGLDAARTHGMHVLAARGSGAEAQLSFAALTDLLEEVDANVFAQLPAPQRLALEVALLRTLPVSERVESRAIALGLLNLLRTIAADAPLLVALDDAQWLDAASAEALSFAARRLGDESIAFLVAKRPGPPTTVERALERRGLEHLVVGPLGLGATNHLLQQRFGLAVRRPLLRRIVEATRGNPLFALEVGRTLAEQGLPPVGAELPVPAVVEDLLGTRVARLPRPVRRLLLAVALSADLRRSELTAITDQATLEQAVASGVLVVERDHVRASHPLLAAAALQHSGTWERGELHEELARVVLDDELRALHLALATHRPDAELAATVAEAACSAAARGAAQKTVVLAEHALRLTPADAPERSSRLLDLAEYLEVAGEQQRLTELLAPELEGLPRGEARVRACLLLAMGVVEGNDEIVRYFERALEESADDPRLRARVLARISTNAAAVRVERILDAEAWARAAVAMSRGGTPESQRFPVYALGWARVLRGRAIDDVCERFAALSDGGSYMAPSPERVAGQRLVWRGEVVRARAVLAGLLSIADERGEPVSYALQRLHLCELELRVGAWDQAERLLDEWGESADRELLVWPMYERCRALLAAGRGLPDDTERWSAEALARAERVGVRWDRLETFRARGTAALLAGRPEAAVESLTEIWEHNRREGVEDPGAFPAAPELVEALVELERLVEAQAVADRLRDLAERQEHPWALATAARCEALIRLAAPEYDADAAAGLEAAAEDYRRLGLRFDRARTLFALGRAQRRRKKWAAARDSLERAAAAFDELGSPGWAEQTRSQLARVGARRPRSADELTPAQQRVAELAAEGLANKEIASRLFVTVSTVEVHLKRVYAKLGIRSRTQLARRLAERD
jgi:DNA-binding CsgD family transcriptional regulator